MEANHERELLLEPALRTLVAAWQDCSTIGANAHQTARKITHFKLRKRSELTVQLDGKGLPSCWKIGATQAYQVDSSLPVRIDYIYVDGQPANL
jgi:hypothetical protein